MERYGTAEMARVGPMVGEARANNPLDHFFSGSIEVVSTFGNADGKSAQRCLLEFFRHLQPGLLHGGNAVVQGHKVPPGSAEGKGSGGMGFYGPKSVSTVITRRPIT
ncbi:MAG: hypothetical protein PVG41_18445 [Desulfobacteraceae bacterium]